MTRLNIDIVDYPGEWLLDLPLLSLDYRRMVRARRSRRAARRDAEGGGEGLARRPRRGRSGAPRRRDARPRDSPICSRTICATPAPILTRCRRCRRGASSCLAISKARLRSPSRRSIRRARSVSPSGSLFAMMERRYEAYKTHVVRPFFRDHFARLDRQIVLVDVLAALNGGQSPRSPTSNAP